METHDEVLSLELNSEMAAIETHINLSLAFPSVAVRDFLHRILFKQFAAANESTKVVCPSIASSAERIGTDSLNHTMWT